MPKVSIVIPVYGVETYIARCARSLFEQTLDDLEYLFVNDCTKDRSIEVLQSVLDEYPSRKPQVKIITHEKNGGQAAARTTGMKAATGEYIIHCDSDDWVDRRMYEMLYIKAKESDADVVVCNYYRVLKNAESKSQLVNYGHPHEWLRKMHSSWICWNKLVKLKIIKEHNIYPIEGLNISEDKYIMSQVFYYSDNLELEETPLYYYDKTREDSIVHKSRSSIEILRNREECLKKIIDFFCQKKFDLGENYYYWNLEMANRYISLSNYSCKDWVRIVSNVKTYFYKHSNVALRICYFFASHNIFMPLNIYLFLKNNKLR